MGHAPHQVFYTYEDYLWMEQSSTVKHEYLDGQIYAMTGGTPEHSRLKVRITSELEKQLKGGRCEVYDADLRIRVLETGLSTYPDASVICGSVRPDPEDKNGATNPTLLVEVTSKSTERYDRTDKFNHYQQVPTLQEYVLVSHRKREIEVRRRGSREEWSAFVVRAGERIELTSINCVLDVDTIYEGIAVPTA